MKTDRRKFIKSASVLGLVGALADVNARGMAAGFSGQPSSAEEISYLQQPLSYAYTALEPSIDALTMEIHYTKHAAGYTKNLSDACIAEKVNTTALSANFYRQILLDWDLGYWLDQLTQSLG